MNIAVVGTGVVGLKFLEQILERQFKFNTLKVFGRPHGEASKSELPAISSSAVDSAASANTRSGSTSSGAAASVTRHIQVKGRDFVVTPLGPGCFNNIDIAFFAVDDSVAAQWAPQAVQQGAMVIDNSAHYRMSQQHILCVPEINAHLLPSWVAASSIDSSGAKSSAVESSNTSSSDTAKSKAKLNKGSATIIANPNCSTIQLVMLLHPLNQAFGLDEVRVCTYQAVSGAGRDACTTLHTQSQNYLRTHKPAAADTTHPSTQRPQVSAPRLPVEHHSGSTTSQALDHHPTPASNMSSASSAESVFERPIAFNCVPRIGRVNEQGFCSEEEKIRRETKKNSGAA